MVMQSIFDNFSQTPTADPEEEERQRQAALGPPQSPLGPPSPPAPDYTPQLQAANQVQGMLANLPGQLGQIDQYNRSLAPTNQDFNTPGVTQPNTLLGGLQQQRYNPLDPTAGNVAPDAAQRLLTAGATALPAIAFGPAQYAASSGLQAAGENFGLPAPANAVLGMTPYTGGGLANRAVQAVTGGLGGYAGGQADQALGLNTPLGGPLSQLSMFGAGWAGDAALNRGMTALRGAEPVPELQRTAPEAMNLGTSEPRPLYRGNQSGEPGSWWSVSPDYAQTYGGPAQAGNLAVHPLETLDVTTPQGKSVLLDSLNRTYPQHAASNPGFVAKIGDPEFMAGMSFQPDMFPELRTDLANQGYRAIKLGPDWQGGEIRKGESQDTYYLLDKGATSPLPPGSSGPVSGPMPARPEVAPGIGRAPEAIDRGMGQGSPANLQLLQREGGGSAIPPGPRDPNNLFDAAGRERAVQQSGPYPPPESFVNAEHQRGYYQGVADLPTLGPRDFEPSRGPGDTDFMQGYKEARMGRQPGEFMGQPAPAAPITMEAALSGITPAQSEANFDALAARNRAINRPDSPEGIAFRQTPEGQAWQAQRATGAVAGEAAAPINNAGGAVPGGRGGGTYQRGPGMSGPGNVRGTGGGAAGATTPPGAGAGGVPPGAGTPPGAGAPPPVTPPGPSPTAGLPPVPAGFVQQWLDHNWARFDDPVYKMGDAGKAYNALASFVTGHPSDSYLAAVVERRPVLEQWLDRSGLSKTQKTATLNQAMDWEITRHFNGDPQQVAQFKQTLNAFDAHAAEIRKETAGSSQFVARLKNTLFGADFGVVGVNTLSAVREGGIPELMGAANRIATALHIPGNVNLEKMTGLPRLDAMRNAGVDLRGGESIRTRGEGTLLSYVPGLSVLDKQLITPVLDGLTKAQYEGLVGFGKANTFEGQLLQLKLAGADISSPKVQAAAAKVTNDIWSSGRRATLPGRAALENDVLLSSGMTRAQGARVLDMAQIVGPNASFAERVIGASMILSNIAFIAGVGKFLNDQVGVSNWQPDPTLPGFGTITLPTVDSDGRHHVISLFSQGTLEKAFAQSLGVLKEGNPEDLKTIWERFGLGRLNPILSDVAKIGAGAGYDTQGHFYTGIGDDKMPRDEALRASIPLPQVAQQVVQQGKTDVGSIGLSAAGINEYPESMGAQKARLGGAVLDDPAKLEAAFPGQTGVQNLLKGKDWNETLSTEKSAITKTLPAEEVKSIHDESMRTLPAITTHSDTIQQLQAGRTKAEDAIYDKFQAHQMTGSQVLAARKALGDDYKVAKDKADADPAFQKELAAIKANGKDPIQAQTLLDQYYNLKADDYGVLKDLRTQFLAAVAKDNPEIGERLIVATQTHTSDSKLQQMYDAAAPVLDAVFGKKGGERTAERRNHPDEDAIVNFLGYESRTLTAEAEQLLNQMRAQQGVRR